MIYVVTEDSGSGRRFWEILGTAPQYQGRLTVLSGGGNVPTLRYIRSLADQVLQPGDTIVSSYDTFAVNSDIPADIQGVYGIGCQLHSAYEQCLEYLSRTKNCYSYISTYGCIECAILTFTRLLHWVKPKLDSIKISVGSEQLSKQEVLLNVLDRFRRAYQSGFHDSTLFPDFISDGVVNPDFDNYMLAFYQRYNTFSKNQFSIHGLESFCAELLFRLTENTGFIFNKSSDNLGSCWVSDCCWDEACKHLDRLGNRKLVNCERRSEWIGFLPEEYLVAPELHVGVTAAEKVLFLLELSQFNTGFRETTYDGSNQQICSIFDILEDKIDPPYKSPDSKSELEWSELEHTSLFT